MLICITIYNEEWSELNETLEGVYTNLVTFKNKYHVSENVKIFFN